MVYNRNAGYPSDWVHLKYLQSELDRVLRGRTIDVEKVKLAKCGWRYGESQHGTTGNISNGFGRTDRSGKVDKFGQHLLDIEKHIGIYEEGARLNHGEIVIVLSSNGCPTLMEPHIETRYGEPHYYYIRICAFPEDVCDSIAGETEGCAGVDRGCSVGLSLSPGAHPMEPGAPPPYEPPVRPPPYEPPTKTYLQATTTPSNARIWLKKR